MTGLRLGPVPSMTRGVCCFLLLRNATTGAPWVSYHRSEGQINICDKSSRPPGCHYDVLGPEVFQLFAEFTKTPHVMRSYRTIGHKTHVMQEALVGIAVVQML